MPPALRHVTVIPATALSIMLAGCTAADPEPVTTQTQAPPPAAAAPEPTESAAPAEPLAAPTCTEMILADTVASFESLGWTFREDEFRVGERVVDGGITCSWADFEGVATDNLQMFGWAPVAGVDTAALRRALTGQGWTEEEAPEGVYVTEDPAVSIAVDEQGYGMTYLFTDDSILLADTKQALLLIEWPVG